MFNVLGDFPAEFDTSKLEMNAVADLFDRNGEGLIDWQEFIAALRPDWQDRKPKTDADKIHDEVKRLVMLCTCRQKFRVFQVGEGKYRVSFQGIGEIMVINLITDFLGWLCVVWRLPEAASSAYSTKYCDGSRRRRMGST